MGPSFLTVLKASILPITRVNTAHRINAKFKMLPKNQSTSTVFIKPVIPAVSTTVAIKSPVE